MAMRPTRWLATVLCAAAIGSAAGCHKPPDGDLQVAPPGQQPTVVDLG